MQGIPEAHRSSARRPARPAWLGLIAALAVGVALAGCSGSTKTPDVKFVTPTPVITATPEPTPTPEPTATPTPKPTPTPQPTVGPCNGAALSVTISAWQNSAGHAQADFVVKNTGTAQCLVRSKSQPILLNGDGTILITGPDPGNVSMINLQPGARAKASVQTANLCAAPPTVPPVQIGFIMAGTGLVMAPPASASDIGGVPSCLGDNNIPSGEIQMTTWVPQA